MTSDSQLNKIVTCPTCKKASVYAPTNPFRPFCSERCKLIDLGAWADESYRIPLNSTPQEEDFLDEHPSQRPQKDDESV